MSDLLFTKRRESWSLSDGRSVQVVAVRDQFGRFHGSTNFNVKLASGKIKSIR